MRKQYFITATVAANVLQSTKDAFVAQRVTEGIEHSLATASVKDIKVSTREAANEKATKIAKHIARVVAQTRNFIDNVPADVREDVKLIKERFSGLMAKAGVRFEDAWDEAHASWIEEYIYIANNS
jgi:hypothetical protein